MGKVKGWNYKEPINGYAYQFPMGKVKMKGLDGNHWVLMYQFPMGKVKNNILCCVYSIHQIYRFVNRIFVDFILKN